ncbi:MAG: four helix bundle protein [Bacteroidota bacterium]
MSSFNRFEDIEAWQLGRELTRLVYRATNAGPFKRDYALRDQIRRACISITSNIAEGFERQSPREFVRFLLIAKASNAEVRSQLYCALDQHYLTHEDFDGLYRLSDRIGRVLNGLIRYLRSVDKKPSTVNP